MEEEEFDALHHALVDEIYRYAARRTSRDMAQEVVAEVFMALWLGRDRIPRVPAEQRAWAYGVARRQLARAQAAESRHRKLFGRLITSISISAVPVVENDVAVDFVQSDEARRVWKQLHPKDQEVLTLIAWEQLSPAEVAGVLGISISNVTTRLHRARRRLADLTQPGEKEATRDTE